MSATVLHFPQRTDAMALFSRYSTLVNEAAADPSLAGHPRHIEERLRAYERFCEAFSRECHAEAR